jgi:multiple sugar transport system permease protein
MVSRIWTEVSRFRLKEGSIKFATVLTYFETSTHGGILLTKLQWREELRFYLFASPWILGFLALFVGPAIASLYLSFTNYDILTPPAYIGTDNYATLMHDPLFWKSLRNTFYMIALGVPIGLAVQIVLAMFINADIRGMATFRTLYYLPYLVPAVAAGVLWGMLFNKQFGILNYLLDLVGIEPKSWLGDPRLAKPSLIIMGLWTAGSGMMIYLAGLKGIPIQLYESARIDGANRFRQFWNITIPLLSPTIFFNLVMSIIYTFQMFTESYVLTRGGPNYATTFYMNLLYNNAFKYFKMGLASAQAWILFVIILFFTLVVLITSRYWVYYEAESGGRK